MISDWCQVDYIQWVLTAPGLITCSCAVVQQLYILYKVGAALFSKDCRNMHMSLDYVSIADEASKASQIQCSNTQVLQHGRSSVARPREWNLRCSNKHQEIYISHPNYMHQYWTTHIVYFMWNVYNYVYFQLSIYDFTIFTIFGLLLYIGAKRPLNIYCFAQQQNEYLRYRQFKTGRGKCAYLCILWMLNVLWSDQNLWT